MKIAVADCRINKKCQSALSSMGFEVLLLPPMDELASPVASHPDMLVFITDSHIFCHKKYYRAAKEQIDFLAAKKRTLVLSSERIDKFYPHDILFNAAKIGNFIICNEKYTSKHIKDYAKENSLSIINTKQGYAKCSTCIVSDNALITADTSIAKATSSAGIDILQISGGGISLPEYDSGFIGGASGTLPDAVVFCGNIENHPDYIKIKDFCAVHGKEVISLSDEKLQDVGTVFFIENQKEDYL